MTYQGIPFQFAASSPQVFATQNTFGTTLATSASLTVNISHPTGLHLLVAGSATGNVAYQGLEIGRVRLTFADDTEYVVVLKPGTHLRPETWIYDTQNQSTPPGDSSIAVTNVITEVQNRGAPAKAFLDKITINLPVAAANKSLTGVHFTDTSISTVGSLAPGFIIAAATVASEPAPPPHTVTAISPISGSTLGGTSVTITGTNFTGATAVTIGGAAAVFTVVDATTITAVTPTGVAGAASVLVTVLGGTNTPNTLFTYVTPNTAPSFSLPMLSAGEIWTACPSGNLSWFSIASSADGTKLAAVALGERIYTSTNSGLSWTRQLSISSSNWGAIASSADGSKLAVAGSGSIVMSSDSGLSWTYPGPAALDWQSIASSTDGTKLAAGYAGGGYIYTSTNSGQSWTSRPTAYQSWKSIASSADGTKLAATASGGLIYTSTDSGLSWAARTTGNRNWWSIASSADGTKLAAVVRTGEIYTSADSGISWIARAAGSRNWESITSSADGTKLAAVDYGGQIYTSTDSGFSWTARAAGVRNWRSIASSADGTKLAAAVNGGQIYTSAAVSAITVAADSGVFFFNSFATGISAGPLSESGQTVSLTVTNDNKPLFTVEPTIAANGTLTFTPLASASGTATVTVVAQDNGGTAFGGVDTSAAQTFTIIITPAAPTVTLSTASLLSNATTLTITGTNFSTTPSNNSVVFTPTGSGTVTAATATSLTITNLSGLTLGALNAVVTSNGQSSGAAVQVATVVSFNLVPTVTAISPNSGSASGGTSVTITGNNFNGATAVTFGGIAATSFSVINATTLTATTPAQATGSVSVLVTTPIGTNRANTLYTYLSNNADLAAISLTIATINEAFATNTQAYTASVPNATTRVTVTPTAVQANATIQVRVGANAFATVNSGSPSASLALAVGTNTIDVKVTAQDRTTTKIYTVTVTRAEGPEIVIRGKGVEIKDGHITPSTLDDTHFGAMAVVSGMSTHSFTITNEGALPMSLNGTPLVSISGDHAADFNVSLLPSSMVAAGSSSTFQITFDPSAGGLRRAVVSIDSDDADEAPYTFTISGTGRFASQAAQTLVFKAPSKLYLAESPFTLSASSSSGLPITYAVISGQATIQGNLLTVTGVGVVKVRAIQSGNADFLAATSVDRTITVAADPTTMTLVNLSQTYTGTPRPITVVDATGAVVTSVDVTYKRGAEYVEDAPINVGSYPVKAVLGATTKTGTLVITKASLFVQPYDQRKFAGQPNPLVLGFSYSGFLGSDNAVSSVSTAPLIATTAKATSAGGLYPITASRGTSANYAFVYLKGTMKVETFAGSYEAMLMDAGTPKRPAAKLELTVAASSKTFTGKLTTPTETSFVSLPSTLLTTNPLTETATSTIRVKRGANTYEVTVTLPLTGDFNAEAKLFYGTSLNGTSLGAAADGRKLLRLATGQKLSYVGTHSALLAPAVGDGVPLGAGWAVATIDAKGLLKLTGKLADGTTFTASLPADVGSNPSYRLFLQPYKYKPARTGTFIAGAFTLKPQLDPGLTGRRYVAFEDAADLTWVKAPQPEAQRTPDSSYRLGFGPVDTRFTLDPWLPPVKAKGTTLAITLAQRLGLSALANQFTVMHSDIDSTSFNQLPTTLELTTTNAVRVSAPLTNATKWKVTLKPTTGAFTGSFVLTDSGKTRTVPFTGIMRQPPTSDPSGLIGDGHFLLPALPDATSNEVRSGEIGFEWDASP